MRTPSYFRLWDDMLIPGRWVLDDPEGGTDWLDPSQFTGGQPVNIAIPLKVGLLLAGSPLDYSISPLGVPVVTERAATVLDSVCGAQVQLIGVAVEGHQGPFFIANATRNADCVDEERSRGVEMWTEQDGRPDRMGEYRSISKLQIDPRRAPGLDLFRVARFPVALIASERLKHAMEEANLLGPAFVPVTPGHSTKAR